MSGNKYHLKDFKNMAQALESEYKNHQNVTKLNKKLMSLCANRGISTTECQNMTPEIMHILNQIWNVKHGSKQTVVNTIVHSNNTPSGNKNPLNLTTEDKKAMHIVNDMNHQHDVFTARNKKLLTQVYSKAKPLVTDINKNYNDYFEVWSKMKTLETRYIKDYKVYYSLKDKSNHTESDKKKMTDIYKDLTTHVIPEFKKLNTALDKIIAHRSHLIEQFYTLYQNIPPEEKGNITLPTTAFEVQKKIHHLQYANQKPKVNVTQCIKKSWKDAMAEGFNPTFYAPCHISRQNELIRHCDSKHDWPYIAYSPNMYQPWEPTQNYSEWMKSCFKLEQYERPYIGV